ncbi:uncharacterized protein ACOB8E_017285 isoform 3-T4 [Sarcophilus harrisii]
MMPFSPPLDFAWIKNGNRGGLGEEREEPTDEETEFQGHYRIYPRLQRASFQMSIMSVFPSAFCVQGPPRSTSHSIVPGEMPVIIISPPCFLPGRLGRHPLLLTRMRKLKR